MALLNQWGHPVRFAHAATRSSTRGPIFRDRNESIEKLIPERDRNTLVALSRRLFTNMGVPRAAILQKADYSVGEAWLPKYTGPDQDAGRAAEEWLRENWLATCDVRGGLHDWHCLLNLVSIGIDRDGDAFVMLTFDGEMPRLQHLPPHLVQTKIHEEVVAAGPYAGRLIRNGIIYDRRSRPVAYRVSTGDKDYDFTEIPARAVIHLYDPTYQEQGRGLPAFTHALEDLRHCLRSTEDERVRQGMLSSLGLIEYNELGGPDLNDPRYELDTNQTTEDGLAISEYLGGQIRYFESNSGSKIEQIKHESPGEIWESFHDRMIRAAVAGVKWSYSLAWKPAGQGTAERAEIEKARRSVTSRQSLLWHLALRTTTFAVARAINLGEIPALDRPMAWKFSYPPRLTVDDGRELKSQMEAWRAGAINMTEIVEGRGDQIEHHYENRAREIAVREKARMDAEAEHGVKIDPREMAMLTPNEVAATQNQIEPQDDDEDEDGQD